MLLRPALEPCAHRRFWCIKCVKKQNKIKYTEMFAAATEILTLVGTQNIWVEKCVNNIFSNQFAMSRLLQIWITLNRLDHIQCFYVLKKFVSCLGND